MQPEQRIHSTDGWCAHVAEASSSPVVHNIVDVLTGGHLTRTNVCLLSRKIWIGRNEEDAVEPVPQRGSEGTTGFPLPLRELINNTVIVLDAGLLFIRSVGRLFLGAIFVRMTT